MKKSQQKRKLKFYDLITNLNKILRMKQKKSQTQPLQFKPTCLERSGNFIQPFSHCTYASSSFAILCEGYESPHISKQIMTVILPSLQYYVDQFLPQSKFQNHKERIANLLLSCREELKEIKAEGSCSIGIVYKAGERIYIFSNDGIWIYLIDEKHQQVEKICQSPDLPFNIKKNHDKTGYLKQNMPKIFPTILFDEEQQLHYQQLSIKGRKNCKIVMGSMQCFSLFTFEELIKWLGGKNQDRKAKSFMQQVKKRWRTIYQKDLAFVYLNII